MTACLLLALVLETTTLNRQLVRMPTLRAMWPKLASSSIELAAGKTLAETELGRSRRSDISQGAEGLPGER